MSALANSRLSRRKKLTAKAGIARTAFRPKPGDPLKRKFMCQGKRYPDMESALASKAARERGATATPCRACEGVHVTGGIRPRKDADPAPRKARRETGPTREVREIVLARDNYSCVCCGHPVIGQRYALQHRDARGMGGTSDPRSSTPVNLITMLGGCHDRVESRKFGEDNAKGYWLKMGQDPAREPVMVFSAAGSGATVWLTGDGGYSAVPPEGGEAA